MPVGSTVQQKLSSLKLFPKRSTRTLRGRALEGYRARTGSAAPGMTIYLVEAMNMQMVQIFPRRVTCDIPPPEPELQISQKQPGDITETPVDITGHVTPQPIRAHLHDVNKHVHHTC